jgi:SNF2 family DNA or RNA helicase
LDLAPDTRVRGLDTDGPARILSVKPYAAGSAVTVTFEVEASGRLDRRILYQADESQIELVLDEPGPTFTGDPRLFRLLLEATRLRLAHLYDEHLALSVSRVQPLPHQLTAVYDEMLPRQPLRFLLADDPGAGKTIMTGLLLKELLLRADVERCLIVVPAALDVQWQDELRDKFGLRFALLGREQLQDATHDPFTTHSLLIGRIDLLKHEDNLERLRNAHWDLVVIDEAHKLGATFLPGPKETKETARYRLGRVLSERTRHLLLLTATPHRGKQADFELLLALLDPDRFALLGGPRAEDDASDLMRRMLKEDLVDFDGQPLFPPRYALTASYALSEAEQALYEAVTHYVRDEMTRADQITGRGGEAKRRRAVVGFALTMLQRRLASSPQAIYRSLERRHARLSTTLAELQRPRPSDGGDRAAGPRSTQLPFELDLGLPLKATRFDARELELDLEERPEAELEAVVDQASAARSLIDLQREVMLLQQLKEQAAEVWRAGNDAKWRQLEELLDDPRMFDERGRRHKLVIFTEHRDTLDYLADRLRNKLPPEDVLVVIHGAMSRDERLRAQTAFVTETTLERSDPPAASILVATDAAGEGINLQAAHLLVNYDLPWNPNRLEQRFGRIHRFGQTRECYNWNLLAANTREGDVYRTLFEKLDAARDALGGRVFDVLGQLFSERPLRDLILDAIRSDGARAQTVRYELETLTALDRYREIVEQHALAKEVLDTSRVRDIRLAHERAEAQRLVPHVVASFFTEAFSEIGGALQRRAAGYYVVESVPYPVRVWCRTRGDAAPERYARLVFDLESVPSVGKRARPTGESSAPETPDGAIVVAPGHPLFEATLDVLIEQHSAVLDAGAVLIDPRPDAEEVRVLACVRTEVVDERHDAASQTGESHGGSARLHFLELSAGGAIREAGPAPHLDYRPLTEDECTRLDQFVDAPWIQAAPTCAEEYVVTRLLPAHVSRVRAAREETLQRARDAVDRRLTAELFRLDDEIMTLRREEAEGRQPRMNVDRAVRDYQELQERRRRRLQELDRGLRLHS